MMQGAGKSGMVFDAMLSIRNKGSVFLEAHPDLEVFRLRLGNALNYEFSEDMQAGLFQRPDPRSGMKSSIEPFGVMTNTGYRRPRDGYRTWCVFREATNLDLDSTWQSSAR
jgi:late competence protein required for DNA uptake (superfamily II DNA/RNA helicase)